MWKESGSISGTGVLLDNVLRPGAFFPEEMESKLLKISNERKVYKPLLSSTTFLLVSRLNSCGLFEGFGCQFCKIQTRKQRVKTTTGISAKGQ
jgi:hypothetical protein